MQLHFGSGLMAKIEHPDNTIPSLWKIRCSKTEAELIKWIYRSVEPIRYEYVSPPRVWTIIKPLGTTTQQTHYCSRNNSCSSVGICDLFRRSHTTQHRYTRLRITANHSLRAVDGLLSGLHEPQANHLDTTHCISSSTNQSIRL